MFAAVRLFGKWPGLIISIRSSKMKIRMGADTKEVEPELADFFAVTSKKT